MFRFPPVTLLTTFETVARHRSFSDAAKELNLTQSAISQRIRKLEDETGLQLFEYQSRNVVLTNDGVAFLELLRPVLTEVSIFHRKCLALTGQNRPIRLGIGLALYRYWLARRLKVFKTEYPHVEIEVVTLWHEAQIKDLDVDLAIVPVPANQCLDSGREKFLFRDSVFPICRPDLLANIDEFDFDAIAQIGIVENLAARDDTHKGDWKIWLKYLGDLTGKVGKPLMRFDSQALTMEAIIQGYGVGLGRTILAADLIAEGQLVRPIGQNYIIPCWAKNILWFSPTMARHPTTAIIADWLADQVARTISAAAGATALQSDQQVL